MSELHPDETMIRTLYHQMLASWNTRNSQALAALFAEEGDLIGFDGSQHTGRAGIASDLGSIFAGHATPTYVGKVRSVELLSAEVGILRAVAGLVPPGQSDLAAPLNAVQTLLACRREGVWCIVLFQNTPAQYHGRPEQVQALTEELRQLL